MIGNLRTCVCDRTFGLTEVTLTINKRIYDDVLYERLRKERNEVVKLLTQLSPAQALLKSSSRTLLKGSVNFIAVRRSIRANRQLLRWANRAIRRFYSYCDEFRLFG